MASRDEESIQRALLGLKRHEFESFTEAADCLSVSRSTLIHRANGRPSRSEIDLSSQRLGREQERILIKWIQDQQRQFLPPSRTAICEFVTQLLQKNGDFKPIGKHWIDRFLQRHNELQKGKSRSRTMARIKALDPEYIQSYFKELERVIQENQVELQDIYNMDETGFQMGQTTGEHCIFDPSLGPPITASVGTTQWVSVIETIAADGHSIEPYVIYVGKEPQNNWFLPSNQLPNWIWAFSPKGWTDNELGLDWLRKCFLPRTEREGKTRILILDNHDSHITGEFQYLCYQANVKLVWIPPHTSHILQPLDVGPFSPLKDYYRKGLRRYTISDVIHVDRPKFTKLYIEARPEAFKQKNVKAGWQRAGVVPWNPCRIMRLPEVKNLQRVTPEFQPEPSTKGIYQTPTNQAEFQRLIDQIELKVSPSTRRMLRQLGKSVIRHKAVADVSQQALKASRKHSREEEKVECTKRLKKDKDQRSWALDDILAARQVQGEAVAILEGVQVQNLQFRIPILPS